MLKIQKKIAVIMENLEYGGVTTHLINLINSKQFMNNEFIIITNKSNKAVKQITKRILKIEKLLFSFIILIIF